MHVPLVAILLLCVIVNGLTSSTPPEISTTTTTETTTVPAESTSTLADDSDSTPKSEETEEQHVNMDEPLPESTTPLAQETDQHTTTHPANFSDGMLTGSPRLLPLADLFKALNSYTNTATMHNYLLTTIGTEPVIPEGVQMDQGYEIKHINLSMKFAPARHYCFRQHSSLFGPINLQSNSFLEAYKIPKVWVDIRMINKELNSYRYSFGLPLPEIFTPPNKKFTLVDFAVTQNKCNTYAFDNPTFATASCDDLLPFFCGKPSDLSKRIKSFNERKQQAHYLHSSFQLIATKLQEDQKKLVDLVASLPSRSCLNGRPSPHFVTPPPDYPKVPFHARILVATNTIHQAEALHGRLHTLFEEYKAERAILHTTENGDLCMMYQVKGVDAALDDLPVSLPDIVLGVGLANVTLFLLILAVRVYRHTHPPQHRTGSVGLNSILRGSNRSVRFSTENIALQPRPEGCRCSPAPASLEVLERRYLDESGSDD